MSARLPQLLKLLFLLALFVGAVLAVTLTLTAQLAAAATGEVTTDSSTISLPTAATFIAAAAVVIPFVQELVTKVTASSWLKVLVALVLNAIAASLATLVASDGGYDWYAFALAFVAQFIATGTAYARALKPSGLLSSVAAVAPTFGVGTKPQLEDDTDLQYASYDENGDLIGQAGETA